MLCYVLSCFLLIRKEIVSIIVVTIKIEMYFRIKKQKNKEGETREYLCIVEGNREGKKVRQKMLANLGRLDLLRKSGNLERLAERLSELVGKRELVDLARDLQADWAKHYGVIQVLRGMWQKLKISKILLEEENESQKEFSFTEAIQAMVINRLVKPSSKLETWRWKDGVFEPAWEDLNLQHFYRAMDYLLERKDEIEKVLIDKRNALFGQTLDLVLFDT